MAITYYEDAYVFPTGLVLRLVAIRWKEFGLRVLAFLPGQRLPYTFSNEEAILLGPAALICLLDAARGQFELWRLQDHDGVIPIA